VELPPKDPIIDFGSLPSAPVVSHAAPAKHALLSASGGDDAALVPELQALADSFVALAVGVKKACEQPASALGKEGARGINDLALFPETKARDLLAHAGMKELQQAALRLSWQVRSGQVCYSAEV
jgi:hypothetical protein